MYFYLYYKKLFDVSIGINLTYLQIYLCCVNIA